jgi:hypothetical protein
MGKTWGRGYIRRGNKQREKKGKEKKIKYQVYCLQ